MEHLIFVPSDIVTTHPERAASAEPKYSAFQNAMGSQRVQIYTTGRLERALEKKCFTWVVCDKHRLEAPSNAWWLGLISKSRIITIPDLERMDDSVAVDILRAFADKLGIKTENRRTWPGVIEDLVIGGFVRGSNY